jgi:cysteinyl-tRNA synthetase
VIKDYSKIGLKKSKVLLETLNYDELLDADNIARILACDGKSKADVIKMLEQPKQAEFAEKYIDEFNTDMGHLGLEKPRFEPKATEHIPDMIGLISTLIAKGYAYQSGGDVFFSVEKFKEYCEYIQKLLPY